MIQTFAKKLLMHETAERVLALGTLTLRYAQKLFLHLHYCQLAHLSTAVAWREKKVKHFVFLQIFLSDIRTT